MTYFAECQASCVTFFWEHFIFPDCMRIIDDFTHQIEHVLICHYDTFYLLFAHWLDQRSSIWHSSIILFYKNPVEHKLHYSLLVVVLILGSLQVMNGKHLR